MRTPIKLTARQRDALCEPVVNALSRAGDLGMLVNAERFDDAYKLARELCDDLCFLVDGLIWGDGHSGAVELKTPPEILRRALSRCCQETFSREASEIVERIEASQEMDQAKKRNQAIVATCLELLGELDAPPAPPR